jgi:hypothetical protein
MAIATAIADHEHPQIVVQHAKVAAARDEILRGSG